MLESEGTPQGVAVPLSRTPGRAVPSLGHSDPGARGKHPDTAEGMSGRFCASHRAQLQP